MKLRGLYAITDAKLTPYEFIERYVECAIDGGAKIVQLRDKELSDEELYPIAKRVKKACKQRGVIFIIDDRAVLAKAVNADGLHIGGEDIDINRARKIVGKNKIIGVSCYGDLDRAARMVEKGADYVAFGSFFPSGTKPTSKVVEIGILRASKKLGVPVCAIGGIDANSAPSLVDMGADMIAVIGALWSGDVKRNATMLSRAFD